MSLLYIFANTGQFWRDWWMADAQAGQAFSGHPNMLSYHFHVCHGKTKFKNRMGTIIGVAPITQLRTYVIKK